MEQIISYGYRKLLRPGIDSPLLTFRSFPVCSMRIRTTSIKEEFFCFRRLFFYFAFDYSWT